jgi:hypothetical protein
MENNTWGLQFVKIDIEGDKFDTLLALNIGSETDARASFDRITNEFTENKKEPDCVVDLLDEEDSIIEDYALTSSQVSSIASLLGHKLD